MSAVPADVEERPQLVASRARVTTTGIWPAVAAKKPPVSSDLPQVTAYCQSAAKIRSPPRRSTSASALPGPGQRSSPRLRTVISGPWPSRKRESCRSWSSFSADPPLLLGPDLLGRRRCSCCSLATSPVSSICGESHRGRLARSATAFTDETVPRPQSRRATAAILICADHDGDEFHQLLSARFRAGLAWKLTDEPQVQHYVNGGAWAPDGTKFAYAANARKPSDMESLGSATPPPVESRPVFGEEMFSFPGPWSPDGTKLLAIEARNNSDTSIHLVDVEGGGSRELTPHDEDGIFAPGPWTRDGSGFYMVADAGSEFRGLALLRPRLGSLRSGSRNRRRTSTTSRSPTTAGCSPGSSTTRATTGCGCAISTPVRTSRAGAARRRAPAPDRGRAAVGVVAGRLSRGFDRLEPAPTARSLGQSRPRPDAHVRSPTAGSAASRRRISSTSSS